jgi:23S rRNA (cytidine2498-2'-O)-methyltransferase
MPDAESQTNQAGPSFAMMCCANGAESQVKREMGEQGWRLAFSRPGFVTAKHNGNVDLPSGIFIRTASHSIGHIKDADGAQQLSALSKLLDEKLGESTSFAEVHVWPRDRLPIGKFGFEPGVDEVCRLVADQIFASLADRLDRCDRPNRIAEPGARILDVVLVDPSDWFIGWHTASTWSTRWPGGVQPIDPAEEPVSRAYFKAAEAIAWSGFEISPGDIAVEVGSAPGGACGRLLELGLQVIGIDPAEMDPRIAGHPRFKHLRARAGDLPRKEFRGARWLLADSNVRPEKTLTTIHHIVTHHSCTLEGLLLTMKLGNYDAADQIPRWIERINQWRPKEVRVRQLARNRCEVCFAIRLR